MDQDFRRAVITPSPGSPERPNATFGLAVPHSLCGFDPEGKPTTTSLQEWLPVLEAAAVDALWVLDQPTGRMATPEPLALLGHIAAVTSRVRLGVAVLIAASRGPVSVARSIATLDWLSGGRVEVGLGLGPSRTYPAYGIDRSRGGGAGAVFDELIDIVLRLWTGEPLQYEGRTWTFAGEAVNPPPRQLPHPPVWIGGDSEAALRRALRLGGRWIGAGRSPFSDFAANVVRLREMHAAADTAEPLTIGKRVYLLVDDDHERAERSVRAWFERFYGQPEWGPAVSVYGPPEEVRARLAELTEAGAEHLLLHPLVDDLDQYRRLVDEVLPTPGSDGPEAS